MIEHRRITVNSDGTQTAPMQWPLNLKTEVVSVFPQSSLDPSCAVIDCAEQAKPINTVEATLDVFGSPKVRVCLCDEHYRLFGATTEEMPDILMDEE